MDIMENLKKSENEISDIERKQLNADSFDKLSDFYSVFADPIRLALIAVLSTNELCVTDIVSILHISQSRVSHQLQILRKHDIVTYYRKGKQIVYTLTDNHIKDLFKTGLEHISEKDMDIYQDRKEKEW